MILFWFRGLCVYVKPPVSAWNVASTVQWWCWQHFFGFGSFQDFQKPFQSHETKSSSWHEQCVKILRTDWLLILMLVKSLGGFPAPSLKWCFDFCFINCAIFVNLSLLLWGDSNDCLGPQITLKFISILALVWKRKSSLWPVFPFVLLLMGSYFYLTFVLKRRSHEFSL